MKAPFAILFKSIVKPYYRRNAAFFTFIFVLFFGVVQELNGSTLISYHYSLIRGFLNDWIFFVAVCIAWGVYAGRYLTFARRLLSTPHYSFLQIFFCAGRSKAFWLFLWMQVWLLLPVLLYSFVVVLVAIYHQWYMAGAMVLLFHLGIIYTTTVLFMQGIIRQGEGIKKTSGILKSFQLGSPYAKLLVRYLLTEGKWILLGLKSYSFIVLYFVLNANELDDYQVGLPFMFYMFGIIGHSLIIHIIRQFEKHTLSFYAALPKTLAGRFIEYALVYLFIIIPEILLIIMNYPHHLHATDALGFVLSGYGMLLFLNSLSFAGPYSLKEFLKISLLVFFITYFCYMLFEFPVLYTLLVALSFAIFIKSYYRFEYSDQ